MCFTPATPSAPAFHAIRAENPNLSMPLALMFSANPKVQSLIQKRDQQSGTTQVRQQAVAKTSSKQKDTLLTSTSGLAKKTLLGT